MLLETFLIWVYIYIYIIFYHVIGTLFWIFQTSHSGKQELYFHDNKTAAQGRHQYGCQVDWLTDFHWEFLHSSGMKVCLLKLTMSF